MRRILRRLGGRPDEAAAATQYQIGAVSLTLPPGHKLPEYQEAHRLYDRFPLALGASVTEGLIVDIGANVGDTAAAFCSAGPRQVMCIEPQAEFFALLKVNAAAIEQATGSQIECVQALIGPETMSGALVSAGGTASLHQQGDGESGVPLDQILAPRAGPVALIKCDVDGFDGDVLLSGRESILKHEPLVFFEAQAETAASFGGLERLHAFLGEAGYDWFTVFDNFGQVMVETDRPHISLDLAAYAMNQRSRSIYYVDILASTTRRRAQHKISVARHREAE